MLCRIQPLRQAPLRQFRCCTQALLREGQEATFRNSYARLPYSRISQFLAASFARNRRFRDFPKFGTFDGCASGVRDGDYSESSREYSLPLTVTQNEHLVDPRGEPAVLCFGYRLGTGVPPWGPPPSPQPRRAQQWQHRAALGGGLRQSPNRPIARRCRRRRARPGRRRVRRLRSRRIGR